MKLNLSVISEHLHAYIQQSRCSDDPELFLERTELDPSVRRKDTVVIIENDRLPDDASGGCFAVVGCSVEPCLPPECEAIVFRPEITLPQAFSLLQETFLFYRAWESDTLKAMAEHKAIEEVLALCARPLRNPIALFDASFVLCAVGGSLPEGETDKTWEKVLRSGYYPISRHSRSGDSVLWSSRKPFCTKTEDAVKASVCLRHGDTIIGYLGSTALNAPFTTGQLSLIHAVQQLFETCGLPGRAASFPSGKISVLLSRLLLGYRVEKSALHYYLKSLHWDGAHAFSLMLITSLADAPLSEAEIPPTMRNLAEIFPDSIIFPIEECIVVLRKEDTDGSYPPEHPLCGVLRKRKLTGFKSMNFPSPDHLRSAYLQCRMLISDLTDAPSGSVFAFADRYEDCMVSALSDSTSLKALCVPAVLELYRRRNGAELVRSLRVFLIYGRNYSDAAEALHVHRNTLIYRIEQAEKALQTDLHHTTENELFRLYLSCLLAERLADDPAN